MYVMLIEDAHTDTEVFVFENKYYAIDIARILAKYWVSSKYPEDYKEITDYLDQKLVFEVQYGCETGCIKILNVAFGAHKKLLSKAKQ